MCVKSMKNEQKYEIFPYLYLASVLAEAHKNASEGASGINLKLSLMPTTNGILVCRMCEHY